MKRRILTAALLAGVLAGCDQRTNDVAFTAFSDSGLRCTLQKQEGRHVVRVDMPRGHGLYMAVIGPGDAFYLIEYPTPEGITPENPDPDWNFIIKGSVDLDVATQSGLIATHPGERQLVFTTPGEFTILVGSDIETEDMLIDGRCKIALTAAELPGSSMTPG